MLHDPKHSLGVINPEEVGIQHGLHQTRHPSYLIHVSLREVPVEPIGNVQRPIQAQRKEIVRCYRFRFTSSLKHEQLGKNCDRFEPDGK